MGVKIFDISKSPQNTYILLPFITASVYILGMTYVIISSYLVTQSYENSTGDYNVTASSLLPISHLGNHPPEIATFQFTHVVCSLMYFGAFIIYEYKIAKVIPMAIKIFMTVTAGLALSSFGLLSCFNLSDFSLKHDLFSGTFFIFFIIHVIQLALQDVLILIVNFQNACMKRTYDTRFFQRDSVAYWAVHFRECDEKRASESNRRKKYKRTKKKLKKKYFSKELKRMWTKIIIHSIFFTIRIVVIIGNIVSVIMLFQGMDESITYVEKMQYFAVAEYNYIIWTMLFMLIMTPELLINHILEEGYNIFVPTVLKSESSFGINCFSHFWNWIFRIDHTVSEEDLFLEKLEQKVMSLDDSDDNNSNESEDDESDHNIVRIGKISMNEKIEVLLSSYRRVPTASLYYNEVTLFIIYIIYIAFIMGIICIVINVCLIIILEISEYMNIYTYFIIGSYGFILICTFILIFFSPKKKVFRNRNSFIVENLFFNSFIYRKSFISFKKIEKIEVTSRRLWCCLSRIYVNYCHFSNNTKILLCKNFVKENCDVLRTIVHDYRNSPRSLKLTDRVKLELKNIDKIKKEETCPPQFSPVPEDGSKLNKDFEVEGKKFLEVTNNDSDIDSEKESKVSVLSISIVNKKKNNNNLNELKEEKKNEDVDIKSNESFTDIDSEEEQI